jgi:hypothetical protein
MAIYGPVPKLLTQEDHHQTWRTLFQANIDALFELALVLTADPHEAELTLAGAINTMDMSTHPDENGFKMLQTAVARRSIENGGDVSPIAVADACSMLRPGLRPLLQVERVARVCFVLRMIFGYATFTCARMLGVDPGGIRVLLRVAILQLHDARKIA